jgi:TIR domain
MLPREIFLSHSDKDRSFASDLTEQMRRHGVPVWYSRTNILGAQQWHDEIGAALTRCDWFVLVLSPSAVRSRWVKNELVFALNDQRLAKRIVPLLYKTCKYKQLSWTLPVFK